MLKSLFRLALILAATCLNAENVDYDPFELTFIEKTDSEPAHLEHKGVPIFYVNELLSKRVLGILMTARANNRLISIDYLSDGNASINQSKIDSCIDLSDENAEQFWHTINTKDVLLLKKSVRHDRRIGILSQGKWHYITIHNKQLFKALKERLWQAKAKSGTVTINLTALPSIERQNEWDVTKFMKI